MAGECQIIKIEVTLHILTGNIDYLDAHLIDQKLKIIKRRN
jgi:hypothetical protein